MGTGEVEVEEMEGGFEGGVEEERGDGGCEGGVVGAAWGEEGRWDGEEVGVEGGKGGI